jgi:hypothetical protein
LAWTRGFGDCRLALSRHVHGREPEWLAGWSLFTILRHGSCYTLPPDFSTSTTWLHCGNVPVVSSSRSRTLESMHKIHGILGVPVLIDAAAWALEHIVHVFGGKT